VVERRLAGPRVRTAKPQWRRAVALVVALQQAARWRLPASPSPSPVAPGCEALEGRAKREWAKEPSLSALAPAWVLVLGRMLARAQTLEQAWILGQAQKLGPVQWLGHA
jgi:hypothetical protein